ncbi:hypothetical protein [Aureivirga sp. CE67]|uniref:hypothetical protein n=1 Tax=Aureivirga sp. CE67 TaxID=1788983 RepID=UPI0018C9EEE4|nr:hypothetical protein [Aureivirga sp. CE67]
MKNKRRLNVQQQIELKKDSILKEAKYWRENRIPKPLEKIFSEKGIEIDQSILLNYEQDFPGICTDEGLILTSEKVFYKFEADLNSEKTELIELYLFIDISDQFEINEHKKGIGKTYGFLAIEILNELNRK